MDKLTLARRAYNKALDRLDAARDAGVISAADAAVQARKLYAAYQTRREHLNLAAFLGSRGLAHVMQGAA